MIDQSFRLLGGHQHGVLDGFDHDEIAFENVMRLVPDEGRFQELLEVVVHRFFLLFLGLGLQHAAPGAKPKLAEFDREFLGVV